VPAASRAAGDAAADEPAQGEDAEEELLAAEEEEEEEEDAAAAHALPKDVATVARLEKQLLEQKRLLDNTDARRKAQLAAAHEIERKLADAQHLQRERAPAPLRLAPGIGPLSCQKCHGRAPLLDCKRGTCSGVCCLALKRQGAAGPVSCEKHKN
jgi:hypothetical protein